MKTYLTILTILLSSVIITGCGGSNDDLQSASFGELYVMSIPSDFESINPKLVENKQITNSVLLSYKKDNEDTFDENIVVTRSIVGPDLDYEQFWTVNSKRLQTSLAGYIPGVQQRVSFDCNGEKVAGLYVTFDVKNTFSNIQELTYLSQYQFVHEEHGYIISFAGVNEKDRDKSDDRLSTITCQ